MCGRFSLSTPPEVIAKLFDLGIIPRLAPRYNIAPTQSVAVIRSVPEPNHQEQKPQRRLDLLHWGLIPHWADDPAIGNRMINAKAETAAEKPAFRDAFKKRRCLVPADGFYEWQKLPGPSGSSGSSRGGKGSQIKQPYRIARPDQKPFALAGLWSYWRDPANPTGPPIESFTILTTEPNAVAKPIHDRMPAIIQPEDYQAWLDPLQQDVESVKSLIKPTPDDELIAFPVSRHVNSPHNDDAKCIEPAADQEPIEVATPSRGKGRPSDRRPGSSVESRPYMDKKERSLFD